jgi:UDP-glucose 4-epimerase
LKIIVTGATGHIGSYLIRDLGLQFKESEIVMIDNMMTQRFSSLLNSQKLEIIPLLKVMLD